MFGYLAIGNSRELAAMAAFTRRLAEGLAADLPLPVALKLAGQTCNHRTIQRAAQYLAADVATGATGGTDSLSHSPASRRFPATLIYVLQLPEQSSSTAESSTVRLLDELADTYSRRVHDRVDWSTGILSQFSVLMVGLLVGAVMLAVLLPLVRLVDGLT
ncbi:MAG: type II secretion system F family protein, partial [Aeoliella sp.]